MLETIQKSHYQEGQHLDQLDTLETLAVSMGLDADRKVLLKHLKKTFFFSK
jgi:protein-disulfide isomerase-like protein with CxxC motif